YDIDLLSRPVTYVIYDFKAIDGKEHDVSIHFGASALLSVNTPDQAVAFEEEKVTGLKALRVGSVEQSVLAKRGDDIRIDWGYLYLAAPEKTVDHAGFGHPL